jgi:hypothetical protein
LKTNCFHKFLIHYAEHPLNSFLIGFMQKVFSISLSSSKLAVSARPLQKRSITSFCTAFILPTHWRSVVSGPEFKNNQETCLDRTISIGRRRVHYRSRPLRLALHSNLNWLEKFLLIY